MSRSRREARALAAGAGAPSADACHGQIRPHGTEPESREQMLFDGFDELVIEVNHDPADLADGVMML